ncbi:hypothetical protein AMTR_s00007p00105810 [Amborella trichopoda]|uniref:Uncharacterized protein n=1 Tax=Amborella trichopoda TaxID=13333 RepID=W1P5X1_AMBTC|nr:hypothetical protein AMTR_s00007p00105810 [Amborella trichopoda]
MGHGGRTPLLRQMAMKILNLTCSSSGLVFVQYNQKLQERHHQLEHNQREATEAFDIDDTCEWMVDASDDEAFPGEGLTWGQVREAAGTAMPPMRTARAQTQSQSQRKGKGKEKAMAKKRKRVY